MYHPSSGGIVHTAERYIPTDEPIDLLNVAFENPRKQAKTQNPNRKKKGKPTVGDQIEIYNDVAPDRFTSYLVPDRETGFEGLAELRRLCPHRIWNFVCRDTRVLFLTEG